MSERMSDSSQKPFFHFQYDAPAKRIRQWANCWTNDIRLWRDPFYIFILAIASSYNKEPSHKPANIGILAMEQGLLLALSLWCKLFLDVFVWHQSILNIVAIHESEQVAGFQLDFGPWQRRIEWSGRERRTLSGPPSGPRATQLEVACFQIRRRNWYRHSVWRCDARGRGWCLWW
jgi:hypothetical protein